jgi:hypothetical protein
VDGQDAVHYGQLLHVLEQIDPWLARIDPEAKPPRPHPTSPMGGDDERLKPYHISHASWSSLTHAVDHLHCLRSVLREAAVLQMYAPYTLIRAALENACAAVWLLQPPRRSDRVTRRLRLAMNDINYGEAARAITGQTGPRTREERIAGVRRIASQCAVDEKAATRKAGYGDIVKAVGDDDQLIFLIWNTCSGIAHGDFWSTRAATEMVPRPGAASPDVGTFAISANVGLLAQFTTIAVGMTSRGWNLYDQRSRSPWQPVM